MIHISKVITVNKTLNDYEVINSITGRIFKVNKKMKLFLDFCKKPCSSRDIERYFKDNDIEIKKGNDIVNKLFNTRVLVSDDKMSFFDTISAPHSLFGFSRYDYNCPSKKSVVFIGVPFGSGNSINIKCKDFPKQIREFAYIYFSCKSLKKEYSYFRKESVDVTFNYDNFCRVLSQNLLYDAGDILAFPGEPSRFFYNKLKKIFRILF